MEKRKPPPPPPTKRTSAPAAPPKLQVVLVAAEPTPEPAFPTAEVIPTAEDAAAAKVEAEVAATKQINFKCEPAIKTRCQRPPWLLSELRLSCSLLCVGRHMTTSQLRKALKLLSIEITEPGSGDPLARGQLEALYTEHCSEEAVARREAAAQPKVKPSRTEWRLALPEALEEETVSDPLRALLEWFASVGGADGPHSLSTLSFGALGKDRSDRIYREAQALGLATLTVGVHDGTAIQALGSGVAAKRDLTPAEGAEQAPLFALLGWLAAPRGGTLDVDELLEALKRRPAAELPAPYAQLVEPAQTLQHMVAGFGSCHPTMPPPAVGAEQMAAVEAAFARRASITASIS